MRLELVRAHRGHADGDQRAGGEALRVRQAVAAEREGLGVAGLRRQAGAPSPTADSASASSSSSSPARPPRCRAGRPARRASARARRRRRRQPPSARRRRCRRPAARARRAGRRVSRGSSRSGRRRCRPPRAPGAGRRLVAGAVVKTAARPSTGSTGRGEVGPQHGDVRQLADRVDGLAASDDHDEVGDEDPVRVQVAGRDLRPLAAADDEARLRVSMGGNAAPLPSKTTSSGERSAASGLRRRSRRTACPRGPRRRGGSRS